MMMMTVIAAALALAAPPPAASAPAAPDADVGHQRQGQPTPQHKEHMQRMMQGCGCCKDMAKAEKAGSCCDKHGDSHEEHSGK